MSDFKALVVSTILRPLVRRLIAEPRVSVAPRHTLRGVRSPLNIAHVVRFRDPETSRAQLGGREV